MRLFQNRSKQIEAQRLILKLVNNHCPDLRQDDDGPRLERRVNLTLPAWIVPLEQDKPEIGRAFTAVTKEFSPSGLSLVVNRPVPSKLLAVGFEWQGDRMFLRGEVRHVNPIGAGFSQLGVRLTEVLCLPEYPELKALPF
jgi:hypothetical protein